MPDYSVRLVLRVSTDSPDRAAPVFLAHMMENGFTDWVYQVCDPDDDMKVLGYFDGFGLPVDVEKLGSPDAPEPAPAAEPSPEQTPVQTESDAELLSLAQDLNDQDQPTEPQPQPQE